MLPLCLIRILRYPPITLRKEPAALDRAHMVLLQGLVPPISHHAPLTLRASSIRPAEVRFHPVKGLFTVNCPAFLENASHLLIVYSTLNFESIVMTQLKSYFLRKVLPNYAKSPSWDLLYRACHNFNFTLAYVIIQL